MARHHRGPVAVMRSRRSTSGTTFPAPTPSDGATSGYWLTFREADAGDGSPWYPSTAPELLRREHGVDPMPRSTACFTESEPKPTSDRHATQIPAEVKPDQGVTVGLPQVDIATVGCSTCDLQMWCWC
jgi:hypothetical protein